MAQRKRFNAPEGHVGVIERDTFTSNFKVLLAKKPSGDCGDRKPLYTEIGFLRNQKGLFYTDILAAAVALSHHHIANPYEPVGVKLEELAVGDRVVDPKFSTIIYTFKGYKDTEVAVQAAWFVRNDNGRVSIMNNDHLERYNRVRV
jgi:hypothetical protein